MDGVVGIVTILLCTVSCPEIGVGVGVKARTEADCVGVAVAAGVTDEDKEHHQQRKHYYRQGSALRLLGMKKRKIPSEMAFLPSRGFQTTSNGRRLRKTEQVCQVRRHLIFTTI